MKPVVSADKAIVIEFAGQGEKRAAKYSTLSPLPPGRKPVFDVSSHRFPMNSEVLRSGRRSGFII